MGTPRASAPFAFLRTFGRAALAVVVIVGWIVIVSSGASRAAAATPDAVTLLQNSLATMQRSVHSLHVVERATQVWPGAPSYEGAESLSTRMGNCSTTAQSLKAAFREKDWGTHFPTVGGPVPVSDWPHPLMSVDSVSDYVVHWSLGHPTTWWTRPVGTGHQVGPWQRVSDDLGALLAKPLCPSSGLFRASCVDTDCSQITPVAPPPNLAVVSRESLGGHEVWHLQSVASTSMHDPTGKVADGVATNTYDYYIARASQRILRLLVSTFAQSDDPAQSWSAVYQYDYSAFNKPVKIKIPKLEP